MFTLRFDMRAPSAGAPVDELYAAALEMTSWSEEHGAVAAIVCEHHGQADGYLPSPMILATALAARTSSIQIVLAVLVLPLYEPIRLAEEMVVLDIISGGRVRYVSAVGYREDEYGMFGVDFRRRGRIADEWLSVLLAAKTGDPFEHDGRDRPGHPAPVDPRGSVGLVGRRQRGRGASGRSPRARVLRADGRRVTPGRIRGRLAPGRPRARLVLSPRGTCLRASSSPTTWTGRGTSSAPTCCTTPAAMRP